MPRRTDPLRVITEELLSKARGLVGKGWARLSEDERWSLIREQAWLLVQGRYRGGDVYVEDIFDAMRRIHLEDMHLEG